MAVELTEISENPQIDFQLTKKFTIFKFEGDEVKLHKTTQAFQLTDRQALIVQQLLISSANEPYLTSTQLLELISPISDIPVSSYRRHIQELVKIQILKTVPVTHNAIILPLAVCYQFNTAEKMMLAYQSSQLTKPEGNNKAVRESIEKSLSSKSLTKSDIDAKKYLPAGGYLDEDILPEEYMNLAPLRRNGKMEVSDEFENRGNRYHVEARAHEQVVTKPALLTLIALLNLSIAYQAKMLSLGRFNEPFEIEETPFHVLDILHVRGLKDSGQARRRIYSHILELRNTIYNWTDLSGVVDDDLKPLFRQKDFQYIVELETNAQIAPVIKGGKAYSTPVLFFIKFHNRVTKLIKEKKKFFAVPWRIAQGDPLTFNFYLALRRMKITTEAVEMSYLKSRLGFDNSSSQLQLLLTKELDKKYLCESNIIDNGMTEPFKYNLCGYYIRFSVNQDGEEIVYVHCDKEEMVRESGAKYKKELGNKNSPTLYNPINVNRALPDELKTLAHINKLVSEIKNNYILQSTQRFSIYKKIKTDISEYTLCAYDSDEHVKKLALILQGEIESAIDLIIDALCVIRAELKPLTYSDLSVSPEEFWGFYNYLDNEKKLKLTVSEFLDYSKSFRKYSLIKWINKDFHILYEDLINVIQRKQDSPKYLS